MATDESQADALRDPRLGEGLSLTRMPAHWMLGRLGKRVMRPGGLGPSRRMVDALQVGPQDDVVEMWPGLGATTLLALAGEPRSYVGIERGEAEAARTRTVLRGSGHECLVAPAHHTGLADGSASVVFGEALLTLEPASRKTATVAEAARLLRPGGRYGVHELLLTPDGLPEAAKAEIEKTLTEVLRVGARPLTVTEWRRLLEAGGFEVATQEVAPLLLLDPKTFVADEGVRGTAAFLGRSLAHPEVLPRLAKMWRVFHRYRDNLGAVVLTAVSRTGT
jgi:hypothetical protein